MTVLLATLAVGFVSALVPVFNAEAYAGALAVSTRSPAVLTLALAAATGQMLGKLLWYQAGRSTMKARWIQKKMASPRWRATYDRWHARTHNRPVATGVLLLVSALVGLPPFAVISVLAGQLRVSVALFLAAGILGRTARFALIIGGVGLAFAP